MKVDCPKCGWGTFLVEYLRAPTTGGQQKLLWMVACGQCKSVVGVVDAPDTAEVVARLDAMEQMVRAIAERVGVELPR